MSELENQYKVCMELIKQKKESIGNGYIVNGDERPNR